MIGIDVKETDKLVVEEFFELFKTPWEYYQVNRHYDVVICSGNCPSHINSKLLLLYGSTENDFDLKSGFN